MKKIHRADFLKTSALVALSPFYNNFIVKATSAGVKNYFNDRELMERLSTANDKQVALLLESVREGNLSFSRKTGYDIAVLTASYCYPGSTYFHSPLLVSKLDLLVQFLATAQAADGTVNIGNLESPPDTAFLMEILCGAATVLQKDNGAAIAAVIKDLKQIIVSAGDALSKGGVHTPNHRWVVSAALSQINALYPDKKYTRRIADWLNEGIYLDKDGHYPERSGTYSAVEATAFITMARFLNNPSLLEPVRRNLEMFYYYIELNGDLVSNDSRRQDQYAARIVTIFYLQYRYMAIRDNNGHFAAITKMIEGVKSFEKDILNRSLFYFLENETLQQQLPAAKKIDAGYEKLFTSSHLLRIKRSDTTITLFGGVDWPLIIASGRSNSPNFFAYRKGKAILKYMRLSSTFFGMGYFYSEGLKKEGNKYILHKKLDIPYYQPLPKNKRNPTGDYLLSPSIDGRFWNKMDFKNRPVSNIKTLETTITFTETNGTVELEFEIKGLKDVPVAIELCFMEGGILSGVSAADNGNNLLEKDFGSYRFENDTIRFGPGIATEKVFEDLEGERYSTHFGSLRTEGMHVFLTGKTPFTHKIIFS